MAEAIRKILIVGGGSSGWLSALFINRLLNFNEGPGAEITVLESAKTGIIGVGEATVISIRNLLQIIGINENEFLLNSDGSFKLGIKFINWLHGKGEHFWHPFYEELPFIGFYSLFDIWAKKKKNGENIPDFSEFYSNVYLMKRNKAPKLFNSQMPMRVENSYAYHFNTELFGKYLAKLAIKRGIKHIVDKEGILDLNLDQNGFIKSVVSSENGILEADFFIDCTGFRGLLINKYLKEPFISFSDSLLCDSAVAVRPPADYNNILPSYTASTAVKNGWIWDIPLFSRRGVGYVYSSAFINKEEAEDELAREYLDTDKSDLEFNHIRMRVGRTRNPWVKNCVAIGLSSGFIEPLESTGIQLIQHGLEYLMYNFPDKDFSPKLIDNYNNSMKKAYESILDFIVMHYCTTKREDTEFWKTAKNDLLIPDTLKSDLELYHQHSLSFEKYCSNGFSFFPFSSYLFILSGMGVLPKKDLSYLSFNSDRFEDMIIRNYKMKVGENPRLREIPDHYQYISTIHRQRNNSFL